MRWTYKRLREQGVRHVGNNHMLGYDEVDGKLTPNDSAWIVRTIFERYAAGAPISAILAEITEKGARCLRTGKPLAYKNITVILDNEAYTGDRLIQKNPPTNYLTKRPDPTQPYDSHFVKEDHEPIIPRELWAMEECPVHIPRRSWQSFHHHACCTDQVHLNLLFRQFLRLS